MGIPFVLLIILEWNLICNPIAMRRFQAKGIKPGTKGWLGNKDFKKTVLSLKGKRLGCYCKTKTMSRRHNKTIHRFKINKKLSHIGSKSYNRKKTYHPLSSRPKACEVKRSVL